MTFRLIRYQTKPGRAAENRGLIETVFAQLAGTGSQDVRYLVLELEDGTFMHLVETPDEGKANPITGLSAFQAFQANGRDRQVDAPQSVPVKVVGNYRMLTSNAQS